jgi:hypothetical protein
MPCIDAVAVAPTVSVGKPKIFRKNVGTLVEFVTRTAFGTVLEPHVSPFGMREFRHFNVTVVVTAPRLE